MKTHTKTLSALTGLALLTGSAHADVILVVDAEGGGGAFNTSDESTGGDTAAGLTGTFSQTQDDFAGSLPAEYWGDSNGGFLTGANTATWTVTGYTPGESVSVFAAWRQGGQGNNATDASYSVNGGAAVLKNQRAAVAANLVLNDGAGDINFESLGTFTADAGGQVQVVLTAGNDFTNMDAVAFSSVPEPGSLALLGLGGLCVLRRRRQG